MTPDQAVLLFSLGLGIGVGGLGWYAGHRRARVRGDVDERYDLIRLKARGLGWQVTLAALAALWVMAILGLFGSPRTVLGLLFFVHMSGWAFGVFHYQRTL